VKLGRAIVATLSIAALSGSLVACSSGGASNTDSSKKQTVTFWQFDTGKPAISAYTNAIKGFEKKYPNITVNMQIVPWAEQQQKITTAIATGSLPDVSMMGNDVVAQYAAAGNLQPITKYVSQWSKEEGTDVNADMYQGDKNYYTYKGQLYGAPVADETRMLYYNKDLFTKAGLDPNAPPTTWAELYQDAVALKSTGKVPWSVPESNQYVTVQTFMSVYLSYGATLFNQSGKCGLDTQAFKDALTYYTSFAKHGLASPDSAAATGDTIGNLFNSGGAAMLVSGPGQYIALKAANPTLASKIGIAPIPAGPKGTFGFLGGWPLVMWKSSKVPDAAAKWMHYATSPQGALSAIAQTSGILPGRTSLASKTPWNEAPYAAFSKQLANAYAYQYPAGPSPKMGQIETASIQTAVQDVATGQMNVDDATTQLCSQINGILAQ
jgi:multiple sugar transport system substrate-binding protein